MAPIATVDHTTRLYRAFHEVGHCMTAYLTGASFEFLELFQAGGGVCRVIRRDDKRLGQLIAAGGFAAEFLLYKASRVVGPDGLVLREKQFIDLAAANAWDDKKNYFGADYAGQDATWPEEMDSEFMKVGTGTVAPQLAPFMAVIETIAVRLEAVSRLSRDDVGRILTECGLD